MNRLMIVVILAIYVFLNTTIVEAVSNSKLEPYAKMVMEREFMIKYENVSKIPGPFILNPDAIYDPTATHEKNYFDKLLDYAKNHAYFVNLELFPYNKVVFQKYDKEHLVVQSSSDYDLKPNSNGVVVVKNDKMYANCGDNVKTLYQLHANAKSLYWKINNYENKKKSTYKTYYSNLTSLYSPSDKEAKLEYTDYDIESEFNYGINLGSPPITRYVYAMLPEEEHPLMVPVFKLVKSTDEYEEYYSDNDNIKEVVRYCFDDRKLVKIIAMAIKEKHNGEREIGEYVININEFTRETDDSYFKLPEYVAIKK